MFRSHHIVTWFVFVALMMPSSYYTTSLYGYEVTPTFYSNPRLWFPIVYPDYSFINPVSPILSQIDHQYTNYDGIADIGDGFYYQEEKQQSERLVLAALKVVDTFVGFASSVLGITQFIQGLFPGPDAPPTTPAPNVPPVDLTPILNAMKNQFEDVNQQLATIIKAQQIQDLQKYSDVELAVQIAFQDMQFPPSLIVMQINAENLYARLAYFMRGMLGKNVLGADILNIINTMAQCGSTTIGQQMDSYITIVNLGMGGIAYYSQMINNKATGTFFDGKGQLATLEAMRADVLKRVQNVQATCGDFAKLQDYVTTVLGLTRQSSSNVAASALKARLQDVYMPTYNWFVFVSNDLKDRVIGGGFKLFSHSGRIAVVAPFNTSKILAPFQMNQVALTAYINSWKQKITMLPETFPLPTATTFMSTFQNNLSTYFSGRQPSCMFICLTIPGDSTVLVTNSTTLPYVYKPFSIVARPTNSMLFRGVYVVLYAA